MRSSVPPAQGPACMSMKPSVRPRAQRARMRCCLSVYNSCEKSRTASSSETPPVSFCAPGCSQGMWDEEGKGG
jgi:hypothetical protein